MRKKNQNDLSPAVDQQQMVTHFNIKKDERFNISTKCSKYQQQKITVENFFLFFFLITQSLKEDVQRQMERERELQKRYGELQHKRDISYR